MKQKKLKIKGMDAPRIYISFLGFIHGYVLRTAEVDSETGYICSSYITEKCKLFNELSAIRVEQLDNELKAVRAEAFDIMIEEIQIRKWLEENVVSNNVSSINEKRSARRCAVRREEYIKNHEKNMKRLGEIDSKIRSCDLHAEEELDAAASALQSCFAAYAQGMLIGSVKERFIPPVEYYYSFDLYQEAHKDETLRIRQLLKEVFDYV